MRSAHIAFPLALVAVLFPSILSAHRLATLTFTQSIDSYYADMDWDLGLDYDKQQITAGRSGRFIIDLFTDQNSFEQADYDTIWLSIRNSERTLFSGPALKPPAHPDEPFEGLLFVFPSGGAYTATVLYSKAGKNLVTVTFPLDVLYPPQTESSTFGRDFWMGLIVGIFASMIAMFLLTRLRKDATYNHPVTSKIAIAIGVILVLILIDGLYVMTRPADISPAYDTLRQPPSPPPPVAQ